MRITLQKYNSPKIKVIALIFCALYFTSAVALPAFHSHFHRHEVAKVVCECPDNIPVHFHQSSFDANFHAKCPFCQQQNVFSLINYSSGDCIIIFAEKIQCPISSSKKYSANFSIFSSRAPPVL